MPTASQLPRPLGRYLLVKEVGAGGMGVVYEAEDASLRRRVAIKVPYLERDDPSKVVERFRREATIASGIDHPNICRVYDFGEIDGIPFLVMPFLEGTTLDRRIKGDHSWPAREAVGLVRTLALALQVIHDRGAVHRDLKPANIMLKDGQPIILDFGLARSSGGSKGLTTTGRAVGTPAYISPEQLAQAEEGKGPGCDIYSLGVILYELLTGRLPFTGENLHQVYYQILNVEARPPSAVRPGLDAVLDGICLKAMAKQVEKRYASMASFAAALDGYLQPEAPAPPANDPPAPRPPVAAAPLPAPGPPPVAAAPLPAATAPPAAPPLLERVDPAVEAGRSPLARRGLGTKRVLYQRIILTRQLLHGWEQAGKFLAWPKKRLKTRADAQEFVRLVTAIPSLLEGFPRLLGEAGQPGYLVVALARQQDFVPTFQTLIISQRESLARDWQVGRRLLESHRDYLREEVRRMRRTSLAVRTVRAGWALLTGRPGIGLLLLLALLALAVAIWRAYFF
jgi:hypothetical protein